ncbi:MAG: spore coat protein U domain-containing protein [Steroidobacterales bacterium]
MTNATSALDGTGTVTVTCTNGSAVAVTLNQGTNPAGGSTDAVPARQMKDAGTDHLAYTPYQDSNRTTVWGNTVGTSVSDTGNGTAQSLTVYGAVAPPLDRASRPPRARCWSPRCSVAGAIGCRISWHATPVDTSG